MRKNMVAYIGKSQGTVLSKGRGQSLLSVSVSLFLFFFTANSNAQMDSDFFSGGAIRVGDSITACDDDDHRGGIRFDVNNSDGGGLQYCDGTEWLKILTGTVTGDVLQGGNSFSQAMIIGTNDSHLLALKTNGLSRLTIDTSGNVGIGTSTPDVELDVTGTMKLSKYNSEPYSCNLSTDRALAMTEAYTLCVCKNGSGWVKVNDGSSACSWEQFEFEVVASGAGRVWSNGSIATSCNAYRNPSPPYFYNGATGDGTYTIDPDGPGGQPAFDAYCDMTTNGGGWTRVQPTARQAYACGDSGDSADGVLGYEFTTVQINALKAVSTEVTQDVEYEYNDDEEGSITLNGWTGSAVYTDSDISGADPSCQPAQTATLTSVALAPILSVETVDCNGHTDERCEWEIFEAWFR